MDTPDPPPLPPIDQRALKGAGLPPCLLLALREIQVLMMSFLPTGSKLFFSRSPPSEGWLNLN